MNETVITVVGTRPELIRLSLIISKLDKLVNHVLVYTNQNFTNDLSGIFFKELGIRAPDYLFEPKNNFVNFLANAFIEFSKIITMEKPSKILILGDTNSGLLSLIANKYNIPIIHMESGNRCFNDLVPEETNRKLIDSLSTYNLPYTENSKQNLINEGYHKNYVFKTGNPIYEVLNYYKDSINDSKVLDILNVAPKNYVLVTTHRAENVNNECILRNIVSALNYIANDYKIVFSVHPRTKSKLEKFKIKIDDNIIISEPLGFFDFVNLEQHAFCVITDSGTVPEESCLFGIPSIIIRDSTERQELVECGSAIIVGTKSHKIIKAFQTINKRNYKWNPPQDYMVENVSDIVINILLGH